MTSIRIESLIFTPPNTHLDLAEKFAAAGKHILLEKPVEITTGRAERLVKACSKVKLGIVLQHRFRPAAEKLRELLPSLGKLVSASAMVPNWRPQTYYDQPGRGTKARDGGGVLLTQAIHTLDLFQSLAGEIAEVSAFATTSPLRKIDTEDIVGAGVRFTGGAVGTVDATTVAYPGFPERIELACEKATAQLNAETLDVFFKNGRHLREGGQASNSGGADPMAFSHEAHKALISDFLDAIDGNRNPVTYGREALKVQVLIEALLRSAEEGRAVKIA